VNTEDVAWPLASVVSVSVFDVFDAKAPPVPVAGAVKVTDTPLTGFWLLSTTVATNGAPNAVLTCASCSDPLVVAIDAGGPEVLVRLKLVVAVTPATLAVTTTAPIVPFAVKADDVATPVASVVSVSVFDALVANVPLAPVPGAVKITNAPLTGDPPIVTVATSGAEYAVLSAALCGVPLVAAIASDGVLKFELLQLVKKPTDRKSKPRMLAQD
jgi:hypothetical protein